MVTGGVYKLIIIRSLLDGEHGRVGDRGLPLVDGLHGAHGDGLFPLLMDGLHGAHGDGGGLFFGRGSGHRFHGAHREGWFLGRRRRGIDRRGRDLEALSRLGNRPPEEVDAGDEREEGQDDEDNEEALNAVVFFVRFPENFPLVIIFRNPPEPTEELDAGEDKEAG